MAGRSCGYDPYISGARADTVILLLGASAESQNGARERVAGTPNILNVAVSRAKQNLYVVGSRKAWSSVGLASHMSNEFPSQNLVLMVWIYNSDLFEMSEVDKRTQARLTEHILSSKYRDHEEEVYARSMPNDLDGTAQNRVSPLGIAEPSDCK